MVNSIKKKLLLGGNISEDFISKFISEAFIFAEINLEDKLYNTQIYGDSNDGKNNLIYSIIELLFHGIYKDKISTGLTKNELKIMIDFINDFINLFNNDTNEKITLISSDVDDNNPQITNEQKQQILNLIKNKVFINKISNLGISPDIPDIDDYFDTKNDPIYDIKAEIILHQKDFKEMYETIKTMRQDP
jgi:hypothetical protein